MWAFSLKLLTTLALISGTIFVSTWIRFNLSVKQAVANGKQRPSRPPLIPYALPYVGSTLTFANRNIGQYWQWLLTRCNQLDIDAVSIILGGTRTNLIFSPEGISSLFKARQLTRYELDQQLGVNVLGMSKDDAKRAFPHSLDGKGMLTTERIHSDTLLNQQSVNALTSRYVSTLKGQLDKNKDLKTGIELSLFAWTKSLMTKVSLEALVGPRLLEMHPDFTKHFWQWDEGLLSMLFGTPKMFAGSAYEARDKVVGQLETWLSAGYSQTSEDSKDVDWEPNFGARVMRRRHEFYKQQKMTIHGQAGDDLIFIGGILSNAIPATGWLLLHLLSPENAGWLLRVTTELRSVQAADGELDIAALTALPILNACFSEMLRLYVDLLVTRKAESNAVLAHHIVHTGEMVMAPTWMTHHDSKYFPEPETFDPSRFLVEDPESRKLTFSTAAHSSYYFPFGGGHYMCPGRNFAKQEVMSTIALLILNFDITFINFVDRKGEDLDDEEADPFPTPKNNLAGNVVVDLDGDLRVTIRRKKEVATKL